MSRRVHEFQAIRSEGGLLPPDLLRRVLDPKEKIEGTKPEDYGLPQNERLNEVVTQSWNRLRKHWIEFQDARRTLPENDPGTAITNDKWSLPLLRELGFGIIPTTPGPEINGRTYAISRFVASVPIHLVGCGLSLDRRAAGVRGAASMNPHGLVQEFLNRSHPHLWAIVSNGLGFRVLRDNQALSRQSFLEFDLETMFSGEVFSDFVLLWLMAHSTRFVPQEKERPETCWLERWTQIAEEQGTRALGDLRRGVDRALQILGEGFTGHPKNMQLREVLRSGTLPLENFHGQLLRIIYRLIFLFVAEDRTLDNQSLLHPKDESEEAFRARENYNRHYSSSCLRDLAGKIKGSRHGDLWKRFQLTVGALSGDEKFKEARKLLALPSFGSFLWDPLSTSSLNEAELTNYDFLEALRHLAFTRQGESLRAVDYKNLGSEELGGIYEGLLALTPQISADGEQFIFAEFAGSERKTSGSYYTPDALVQCLLDSVLDPVVEQAIKDKTGNDAEKAILELKVCDPAVGSGHFLIGAAHRLARHLARVRAIAQGESEPSPILYQHALRDVIGRCLYGVDINPMSAELCRVSLWLEALEPGKPLSFLDHHIRVGNSLLGATPDLISKGIPDKAFNPIQGDDKNACAALKKFNKSERKGWGPLFAEQEETIQSRLEQASAQLDQLPDNRPEDVKAKELAFRKHEQTEEYQHKKLLADTWCAAFVIEKYFHEPGRGSSVFGITQDCLNKLANDEILPDALVSEINKESSQYQFFHWHLAFPEVFARGGFDCLLANPPWERVKIQEKEWFAQRSPEIANAPNAAARKKLIEALKEEDPALYKKFFIDLRQAEGESHFMRHSVLYPLCGRGDINLYTVFAERMRNLLNDKGRVGTVLPSGICTDDTTKFFFQDVVEKKSLVSLFDFENKFMFPDVDSRMKFCLFTSGQGLRPTAETAEFIFFAHKTEDLHDPKRRFKLSAEDTTLLNPNTRTCPIFRSRTDAELTKAIYRRVPVLIREKKGNSPEENPWGIKFKSMFHMSNDSHLFRTREQLESDGWRLDGNIFCKGEEKYLPLYEAKMVNCFDHRAADIRLSAQARQRKAQPSVIPSIDKLKPDRLAIPLYWVKYSNWEGELPSGYKGNWFLGFSSVTSPTNERTFCPALVPKCGSGNSFPLIISNIETESIGILLASISGYAFDYMVRQKIGGVNLNFYLIQQFPVYPPKTYKQPSPWFVRERLLDWLLPRVLELIYTANDMGPFAQDCGYDGPPFRWDEERRFLIRCELDAAFFHLYLPAKKNGGWQQADRETEVDLQGLKENFPTPRDSVDYIMETFPIVKRKDEKKFDGDYRTKRVILEIYDSMAESIRTGQPYQTLLKPPPADPKVSH